MKSNKNEDVAGKTFAQFAEEFLQLKPLADRNSVGERSQKEIHVRVHLLPFFGHYLLSEISTRHIDAYRGAKLRTLAEKTVRNHMSTLRRMLNVAVDWGYISGENKPKFDMPKLPRALPRFLKPKELERLNAQLQEEDEVWRVMVLTALYTAMRVGELQALRWEDVDFKRGFISIERSLARPTQLEAAHLKKPKNGEAHKVKMAPALAKLLKGYKRTGEVVFGRLKKPDLGEMQTYLDCQRALGRIYKAAKIKMPKGSGWHLLRHTAASMMAQNGESLYKIKEVLGHSSLEQVMVYAHLTPDAAASATVALADALQVALKHGRSLDEPDDE